MTKTEIDSRLSAMTPELIEQGLSMIRDGYSAQGISQNSMITLKQANALFAQRALDTAPKPAADPNTQYLVLSYDISNPGENGKSYLTKTRVYMVPAHKPFHGFGGSRSGLVTGKTPSLIMRQTGPWGLRDHEYDITDASAWGCINAGLKLAAAEGCGVIHHCGLAVE